MLRAADLIRPGHAPSLRRHLLKGDISFFGIELFPDKNANPSPINDGLATATQQNRIDPRWSATAPILASINTRQIGIDISAISASMSAAVT